MEKLKQYKQRVISVGKKAAYTLTKDRSHLQEIEKHYEKITLL